MSSTCRTYCNGRRLHGRPRRSLPATCFSSHHISSTRVSSDPLTKGKRRSPSSGSAVHSPPTDSVTSPLYWLMVICGACAFILYANTLTHDYAVDDQTAIIQNKLTQQGVSALPTIFTSAYRAGVDDRPEGLYRPLSIALFAIEWQLSGGDPRLGHWVNVLLYVVTAFMLFLALTLFLDKHNILLPFIATLLFVTHPIHTEVVANIKSRDEDFVPPPFTHRVVGCRKARAAGWNHLYRHGRHLHLPCNALQGDCRDHDDHRSDERLLFQSSGLKRILISAAPFAVALVAYISMRMSV